MFEYLTPFFRFRLLLSYLLPLAAMLAHYVFLGLALSRLSRALVLPHPCLSWIPFGQLYRLGQVADRYTDNRMTSEADRAAPYYAPSDLRRKLLGYGIGSTVAGAVAGVAFAICATVGVIFFFLLLGGAVSGEAEPAWISETLFLITGLVAFAGGIFYLVMTILFLTVYCPALCRVFTALGVPAHSLLTAVSVFVPVLGAILIFIHTRRTEGLSERFAPPTF